MIYDKLIEWKKKDGISSLLIEGPRRVGKSTIAKEFAKNKYKSYIYIDFNRKDSEDVIDIFENHSSDLNEFFELLKARFQVELYERQSLIIFDEVQQYPFARALTKYLIEDGRYDYMIIKYILKVLKKQ